MKGLEKKILGFLSKRGEANTTNIAKGLGVSRTTAISYLKKLLLMRRISYREEGPSKLWFVVSPRIESENVPEMLRFMRDSVSVTEKTFSKTTSRKFEETLALMENELRLQRIRSKIANNLRRARSCLEMLDALEIDMSHRFSGYSVVYAIDYHDLCRYLHPSLDNSQTDWKRYSLEQTALHYAFSDEKYQFVLLPPYAVEFILHMRHLNDDYKLLGKVKRPADLLQRLSRRNPEDDAFTNKELRRIVESNIVGRTDLDAVIESHNSLRETAGLLNPKELKSHLVDAVALFRKLNRDAKVVSLKDVQDADSKQIVISTFDREYLELIFDLNRDRPSRPHALRYFNNHVDAVAALTVKTFSERNLRKDRYMVLLSSTTLIRGSLLDVAFESKLQDKKYSVPVLRDLNYILLSFYFGQLEPKTALLQLRGFRRKLKRYTFLMEELESTKVATHYTSTLIDLVSGLHDELEKSLWDLGPIVEEVYKKTRDHKRIKTVSELRKRLTEVNRRIKELSKNPDQLRRRIEHVILTLDASVKKLDRIFAKYVSEEDLKELTGVKADLSR